MHDGINFRSPSKKSSKNTFYRDFSLHFGPTKLAVGHQVFCAGVEDAWTRGTPDTFDKLNTMGGGDGGWLAASWCRVSGAPLCVGKVGKNVRLILLHFYAKISDSLAHGEASRGEKSTEKRLWNGLEQKNVCMVNVVNVSFKYVQKLKKYLKERKP